MKTNFFYRLTCMLGFLAAIAALGAAYYMQHVEYLEPCPMCMLQRIVFMLMAVIFIMLWLFVPATIGRRIWAFVLIAIGGVGIALAYRHLQIMDMPSETLAAGCSTLGIATESSFWQAFFSQPIQVITEAWQGGKSCAVKQYQWGLLIPVWALIGYVGLSLLALIGVIPKAPSRWMD